MVEGPLHPLEKKVLRALVERPGGLTLEELAREAGIEIDQARRVIEWLRSRGLLEVEERTRLSYRLGDNGLRAVEEGLPERRLLEILLLGGGKIDMADLVRKGGLSKDEFDAGIGRLVGSGSIEIEGRTVKFVKDNIDSYRYERLLRRIGELDEVFEEQLDEEERAILHELKRRSGYIVPMKHKGVYVRPSLPADELKDLVVEEGIEEITALTPEILADGRWRHVKLTGIDVTTPVPSLYPGREHPISTYSRMVRRAFLSMGFEEVCGGVLQTSFWNFDVLYTPQDHPARDLQDTFYIEGVSLDDVPSDIVDNVGHTHENGWITGSRGWGYEWDAGEARRILLRTHTTVLTVKALHALRSRPLVKVFSIGRVFRNEKADAKHLVEFHQIEGIVKSKNANLRQLMGYISEFYRKLGFTKVKFWPTYFPYTEPSLQIMVHVDELDRWLELGGMGIFRPEVTIPLGVKDPVLAWGLGLERIVMLALGIHDARRLYDNRLSWLRGVSMCQS